MKKNLLILVLMCLSITVMAVSIETLDLDFQCELIRQKPAHHGFPRTPVKSPSASLNDHTLYIEGATGCTLQLLQDGEIVYSTVILSETVVLPEELSGTFELQIIRGNYCFWTEIEL